LPFPRQQATEIADNMRVKEVQIGDTDRFVICHNPEAAARDQHTDTHSSATSRN
jgi:hypothetical protein